MTKHRFKGIDYQSTGEEEIAKFLNKMEIAFEYEFPIAVVDDNKTKIWYPDFYLKEYQIVIEYFGMYQHNESYRANAEHKKEVYKNCGVQFVPIYKLNKGWEEYLLNTIFTFIDYKRKNMSGKIEKLEKSRKFKNFLTKLNPFAKKEEEKKPFKKNNNKARTKKKEFVPKPSKVESKSSEQLKKEIKDRKVSEHYRKNSDRL